MRGWQPTNQKEEKNMNDYSLGVIETKFAEIIWDNEPIKSGDLVKICMEKLGWKKPTTYSILRKLCFRGFFVNNNGIVTSLISKDEFSSRQANEIVQKSFEGSLPKFIAAFSSENKLTAKDIEAIKGLLKEMDK